MAPRISIGILAAAVLCAVFARSMAADAPPTDSGAFVNRANQASMMELAAASLAQSVSRNAAVKSFSARMTTDHRKAQAELNAIAKAKKIPVPALMDAENESKLQSLRAAKGSSFDASYARQMVLDHAAAVALFQANVSNPDGELAAFAAKTLTVVQEHKRLADNLLANMKVAAP